MATTVPGAQTVKPQSVKPRGVSHEAWAFDDDPTEYPDFEPVGREPIESNIAEAIEPVIRRHMSERGIRCYVGSDNFIYWTKGNNKDCVSPDIYVVPGMGDREIPQNYKGHKNEGSWKTWIHDARPTFTLEVKAWRNPRKDELQSPDRHDRLGVKELIVYDLFFESRRRADLKRFAVYRRDSGGAFPKIFATNDDRVFSEELGAFLVADSKDNGFLRLGVGPRGENLLLFDEELITQESRLRRAETRRADAEARLHQEEARLRQEEARRADEEARLRQEEARRADVEARLRQEEARRADEATQRAAELEAELARLRASIDAPSKRSSKK